MGTSSNVKRIGVALGLVAVLGVGLGACAGDDVEHDTVEAGQAGGPDDSTAGAGSDPGSTGLPDGPPTIVATVVSGDAGPELTDVQAGSASDGSYYSGGIVRFEDEAVLLDAAGEAIGSGDVFEQPAEIWLGACQESYPVQCAVEALQLLP